MRRIGDYYTENKERWGGIEKVTEHLRRLLSDSPKTSETITGLDQLISREKKRKN